MKRSIISRIPPRFRDANLKHVDKDAYRPVLTYLKDYKQHAARGVGLLLSGPVGVGKTYTISALTLAIAKLYEPNLRCEFVTGADFFDRVRPINPDGYDEYRDQTWVKTYSTIQHLVINDLGKEYRGGGFAEQATYCLGKVLRARSENLLTTYFTTNLAIKTREGASATIEETYGGSVTSLLREMIIPVTVVGADMRRANLGS